MIEYSDVIVDLQAGDTGKGKVAHALCKDGGYTHVVRYNGGGNAGHTIYHEGKKFVTHFIPCGILYGIKSIIGLGCVVDEKKLEKEIEDLKRFLTPGHLKHLYIDHRAHIILPSYVEEDSRDDKIGTTKTGNGPAYREKYNRTGVRAIDHFKNNRADLLIDSYSEFHGETPVRILFEGAQGFELDVDWGDYPYVTSSHCTVGSAILNGVPPNKIRKIYGVAKAYRTYVGNKNFEGNDEIFSKIRTIGEEYGATTGRPRQVNWLDLNMLIKAININGVTNLIINKLDVLNDVNRHSLYHNNQPIDFINDDGYIRYIKGIVNKQCPTVQNIKFSLTPYDI
jgi:adenylosuccinate synthase